ncbi:hypothetical protein E4U32_005518 [Claviceps aff. humidiphila group G2b]|nr:hypothetical protein E4U32_005518 [Claviceps aff. humidiphila group G2b]
MIPPFLQSFAVSIITLSLNQTEHCTLFPSLSRVSVSASKRPIGDVQSPQAARTPLRHSRGTPHTESAAVGPRPRTPTRPAIKSALLTRDNGGLQYHRLGQRSGESLSQAAARNERERTQRCHRAMAASPMLRQIYASGSQFTASPTLRQSGGPDSDDVFGPTSAQPRVSIAPSARSGQYRSPTVSDESGLRRRDRYPLNLCLRIHCALCPVCPTSLANSV